MSCPHCENDTAPNAGYCESCGRQLNKTREHGFLEALVRILAATVLFVLALGFGVAGGCYAFVILGFGVAGTTSEILMTLGFCALALLIAIGLGVAAFKLWTGGRNAR